MCNPFSFLSYAKYVAYSVCASTGACIIHWNCFAGCGSWAHPYRPPTFLQKADPRHQYPGHLLAHEWLEPDVKQSDDESISDAQPDEAG